MSESYERERQNNSRLDDLAGKVSALRGVTIDIYDNARDQGVIDSSVRTRSSSQPSPFYPLLPRQLASNTNPACARQNEVFSNFGTSLKGSAGRLGRMAQQGNKVAILKLAGILVGVFLVLYYVLGWVFGGSSKGNA